MIKCLICGAERKMSIIAHLIKTHKINPQEYKKTYKAEIESLELINERTNRIKKLWQSQDFKEKMSEVRKAQFTPEVRDKMSKTNKEQYKNGRKTWCFGLTKETHPSLIETGLKKGKLKISDSNNNSFNIDRESTFISIGITNYF
jgi:hypothetical protein